MGKRIYTVGSLLTLFVLIIIGKLAYVQFYCSPAYASEAFSSRANTLALEEYARGDILDRHGKSLLGSHTDPALVVIPQLIADPESAHAYLDAQMPANDVQTADLAPDDNGRYPAPLILPIKDNSTLHTLQQTLPGGMVIAPYHWRYDHPLAVHLLGYLNYDGAGARGIEKYYDDKLRGHQPAQSLAYISDAKNQFIAGNGLRLINNDTAARSDLILTLDYDVQALLEATLDSHHLAKGAAVILDISTNQVLAAASRPVCDPIDLSQTYGFSDNQLERCLSGEYRYYPGSSFKIATALAALEEGVANEGTTFECSNEPPNNKCPRPHGSLDFAQALKVSCNNYFIHLGESVGSKALEHYFIDTLHFQLDRGKKLDSNTAIANGVIGQELFRVTPLQMAQLIAAVAHDGQQCLYDVPWQEQLTLGLKTSQGCTDLSPKATWQQAFSPETAHTLQRLLAASTQLPDGSVITYAGKTGTPEIYNGSNKTYLAWYVGYAPADHPRYAIAIVIEEIIGLPTQELSGGKYALPIFQDLIAHLGQ